MAYGLEGGKGEALPETLHRPPLAPGEGESRAALLQAAPHEVPRPPPNHAGPSRALDPSP